jgi:dTDP-4-dehydrorhamnose 3,5-epimerase
MASEIAGVIVRDFKRVEDSRGWLLELFRQDELANEAHPAMAYMSMTRPGVTRGPHEHRDQIDYFGFVGPSVFRVYLWDNRPDSATFKAKYFLDVGENRPASILVPSGVVHAYKNIGSVDGIVFNAPNRLYAGYDKSEPVDEIRHEDRPDSLFKLFD